MNHGEHKRSEGSRCKACHATEARCALLGGCCATDRCTHWRRWTADGEPPRLSTAVGGRPVAPVIDAVTAKRREQWRNRRRWAS